MSHVGGQAHVTIKDPGPHEHVVGPNVLARGYAKPNVVLPWMTAWLVGPDGTITFCDRFSYNAQRWYWEVRFTHIGSYPYTLVVLAPESDGKSKKYYRQFKVVDGHGVKMPIDASSPQVEPGPA